MMPKFGNDNAEKTKDQLYCKNLLFKIFSINNKRHCWAYEGLRDFNMLVS
jgi:hypothetical protein